VPIRFIPFTPCEAMPWWKKLILAVLNLTRLGFVLSTRSTRRSAVAMAWLALQALILSKKSVRERPSGFATFLMYLVLALHSCEYLRLGPWARALIELIIGVLHLIHS
jgi:hypothetical protein